MIKINQLKVRVGHNQNELKHKIESDLNLRGIFGRNIPPFEYKILRKSLDARRKPELYFIYAICIDMDRKSEKTVLSKCRNKNVSEYNERKYEIPRANNVNNLKYPPVVIGSGPAGLFAAYLLSLSGYSPIVFERGENVDNRVETVEKFWTKNSVNKESNVQFGEGGAGTFSDGKLNTLVKDPNGRNQFVLDTFVKFGASEEVAYTAKPHVGTDKLVNVVKGLRNAIVDRGGQFVFSCKMTKIVSDKNAVKSIIVDNFSDNEISLFDGRKVKKGRSEIEADAVILAIGHSARDTFEMLNSMGIFLEQKNFAVGLRMMHPQRQINLTQYGSECVDGLLAADYKLTNKASNGRSVYSFCMCPGGYVVNASSEASRLCVNGMSYSGRNSDNANSALIVSVGQEDFGSSEPLAGMYFQRKLEEKAYNLGKGQIPTQTYGDYKAGKVTNELGEVKVLSKGGYEFANLRELFSAEINDALIESVDKFGYTMKDYDREDAVLMGVESRTSSPVRIVRDNETFQSISLLGLYPCGEGAGYAGGITSAAMDGMKVAEAIIMGK